MEANDGAEEGQAFGLSHYLAEPGEGLAKGIEIARRIAGNSPTTNFAILNVLPRIAESEVPPRPVCVA